MVRRVNYFSDSTSAADAVSRYGNFFAFGRRSEIGAHPFHRLFGRLAAAVPFGVAVFSTSGSRVLIFIVVIILVVVVFHFEGSFGLTATARCVAGPLFAFASFLGLVLGIFAVAHGSFAAVTSLHGASVIGASFRQSRRRLPILILARFRIERPFRFTSHATGSSQRTAVFAQTAAIRAVAFTDGTAV